MQYKVSELVGDPLDAAVAKVLADPRITMWGDSPFIDDGTPAGHGYNGRGFKPSTDPRDGHPIIENHQIDIEYGANQGRSDEFHCRASAPTRTGMTDWYEGETALMAASRAFVASEFGETIELP